MGYEDAVSTKLLATTCVFCGLPLRDPVSVERGVGPECWSKHFMADRPTPADADHEKLRAAMEQAPEPLQARWRQLGGDPRSLRAPWATDPEVRRKMLSVGLHHGALAVSYGSSSVETAIQGVDTGMLVVTTVQNFAAAAGYPHTAVRIAEQYVKTAAIVFTRDPRVPSNLGVHTPFNDTWIRLTRENRALFTKSEKEGQRFFRFFHESDLRTVINMLQGVFGDAYCLNPEGDLLLLPAMPLPEELPAPPGGTPKKKVTNETLAPAPEVDALKLGDSITLPDGTKSIVQFIDPKKQRIGVGPRKRQRDDTDYSYTFFSFEQAESVDGQKVSREVLEKRKQGRAEERLPAPDFVRLPRSIPAEMFEFQVETVEFIEKHGRVIVALEQGLGKSLCGAVAIDPPAICVVPSMLKVNWVREIGRWRPELSVLLVEGTKPPSPEQRKVNVVVINYDVLYKHLEWLKEFGAKTLLADEAQALKNLGAFWESSERRYVPTENSPRLARAFYELHWGAPKLLFLTGTPIMNRTKEIWPLIHMCNKEEWGNQKNFQTMYCAGREEKVGGRSIWNANGRSNIPELHQRLIARYMVRRTKAEVLKDLPPKSRQSIAVSMDLHHKKLYARIVRDFLSWVEEKGGPEAAIRADRAMVLARMTALRRAAANGKAAVAVEWIKSHWEGTQRPLIVMGIHADALDKIAAGIDTLNAEREAAMAAGEMPEISRPIRYGRVTGSVPKGKRQKVVDEFQIKGELDLLLYSIKVATGTTLTRATEVLFVERLWRPADQAQAEDRVHRIGTTMPVMITYLDAAGTIDDKMALMLMDKAVTAAGVVDGVDLDSAGAQDLVYGEMFGFDVNAKYDPEDYEFSDLIDDAAAGLVQLEREIADEMEENRRVAEEEESGEDVDFDDMIDSSWNQPL